MLLLYAVAIGLILGLASGGKLAALGATSVRFWPVALLGLVGQVVLFSTPVAGMVGAWGPSLYVVSTTFVLMALVVNLRQPGFWLIIVGALLNFTVIVANGGLMPASPDAWAALNGIAAVPTTAFSNSVLAGPATAFPYLGDNFVLPRPLPFANVFSIGDVLIGAGGALFIFQTMHGRVLPRLLRSTVPVVAPTPAATPAATATGTPAHG